MDSLAAASSKESLGIKTSSDSIFHLTLSSSEGLGKAKFIPPSGNRKIVSRWYLLELKAIHLLESMKI